MKKEILRVEHLAFSAPNRQKLDVEHLNLFKGESIALMGLTDSGVSLFVEILCGKTHASHGKIIIDEKTVHLTSEGIGRFLGIYRISQEQTLIDELDIAANIFVMRRNSLKNIFLDRSLLNSQSQILLQALGINLSPTTLVGRLSLVEKKLVELTKAIGSGAKIIIFDEVLSSFNDQELSSLQTIVKKLKEQGTSFIFCCHNGDDVRRFTEKVVFFKEGKISKKIDTARFLDSMIADYVVGYELERHARVGRRQLGGVALGVDDIELSSRHLSFSVRHGEVVGLIDIDSNEKEFLSQILAGNVKNTGSPIRLNGREIGLKGQDSHLRQKIVLISDITQPKSLLYNLSIEENLLFPSMEKIKGLIGYIGNDVLNMLKKELRGRVKGTADTMLDLTSHDKLFIILERWLIYRTEVLILVDPFSKTDEVGCGIISEFIGKFTKAGAAVIIITSRQNRLDEICDRVIDLNANALLEPSSVAADLPSRVSGRSHGKLAGNLHENWKKYAAALFIILAYIFLEYHLLSIRDITILLRQFSIMGFAVLGVYLTVLCDGFNFSVGAQAALTTVLAVFLYATGGLPVWLIVIITFAVAILQGMFFALSTLKTGIPILLFSLGTMFVLNGINAEIQNITPGFVYNHLHFLAYGGTLNIPISLCLFITFAILVEVLLNHTYLGKSIFAVGSNEAESRRSGLPVNTVKIAAYIASFMLINITGLIFLARTSMAGNQNGNAYYFDVLAALCIGRISLWGGKGTVNGVILGTLSIILLDSFFIISGSGLFIGQIIKGFIIVVMVILDYRSRRALGYETEGGFDFRRA